MAYDPKKKRPKPKSLDSVVDEIFGEEEPAPEKKSAAKKPSTSKPKDKSNVTSIDRKAKTSKPVGKPKAAKKAPPAKKEVKKAEILEEVDAGEDDMDNVLPFHSESQGTPLVMQPQVWVATGIAALIVLLVARKRKKS